MIVPASEGVVGMEHIGHAKSRAEARHVAGPDAQALSLLPFFHLLHNLGSHHR